MCAGQTGQGLLPSSLIGLWAGTGEAFVMDDEGLGCGVHGSSLEYALHIAQSLLEEIRSVLWSRLFSANSKF